MTEKTDKSFRLLRLHERLSKGESIVKSAALTEFEIPAKTFQRVIPTSIYIQRTEDARRVVGLLCNYKFDAEDGIAVVFENETIKSIGNQDKIL